MDVRSIKIYQRERNKKEHLSYSIHVCTICNITFSPLQVLWIAICRRLKWPQLCQEFLTFELITIMFRFSMKYEACLSTFELKFKCDAIKQNESEVNQSQFSFSWLIVYTSFAKLYLLQQIPKVQVRKYHRFDALRDRKVTKCIPQCIYFVPFSIPQRIKSVTFY